MGCFTVTRTLSNVLKPASCDVTHREKTRRASCAFHNKGCAINPDGPFCEWQVGQDMRKQGQMSRCRSCHFYLGARWVKLNCTAEASGFIGISQRLNGTPWARIIISQSQSFQVRLDKVWHYFLNMHGPLKWGPVNPSGLFVRIGCLSALFTIPGWFMTWLSLPKTGLSFY